MEVCHWSTGDKRGGGYCEGLGTDKVLYTLSCELVIFTAFIIVFAFDTYTILDSSVFFYIQVVLN